MNFQLQLWMLAVLLLFGTLVVVVLTNLAECSKSERANAVIRIQARRQNRLSRAEIQALRAEIKQSMAELEPRLSRQLAA